MCIVRLFGEAEDSFATWDENSRTAQRFIVGWVVFLIECLQKEYSGDVEVRMLLYECLQLAYCFVVDDVWPPDIVNERSLHGFVEVGTFGLAYQLATVALKIWSVMSFTICVTSSS